MTTATIPASAIRLVRVSTDDYAIRATLTERAMIAAARPERADDMRVGTLQVYAEADMAYIEWREHADPLNPESTVATLSSVQADQIEREIATMRDRGVIPAHIAASALADLE